MVKYLTTALPCTVEFSSHTSMHVYSSVSKTSLISISEKGK